jgi:hypothetical protein
MDNPNLPLAFRKDCAAIALPYRAAKLLGGVKPARDDPTNWYDAADDDDGMGAALRPKPN